MATLIFDPSFIIDKPYLEVQWRNFFSCDKSFREIVFNTDRPMSSTIYEIYEINHSVLVKARAPILLTGQLILRSKFGTYNLHVERKYRNLFSLLMACFESTYRTDRTNVLHQYTM